MKSCFTSVLYLRVKLAHRQSTETTKLVSRKRLPSKLFMPCQTTFYPQNTFTHSNHQCPPNLHWEALTPPSVEASKHKQGMWLTWLQHHHKTYRICRLAVRNGLCLFITPIFLPAEVSVNNVLRSLKTHKRRLIQTLLLELYKRLLLSTNTQQRKHKATSLYRVEKMYGCAALTGRQN